MKFKTILTTALLSTSSLTGSPEMTKSAQHIISTKQQLTENLTTSPEKTAAKTDFPQKAMQTIDSLSTSIETFSVSSADLAKTPFDPGKPMK